MKAPTSKASVQKAPVAKALVPKAAAPTAAGQNVAKACGWIGEATRPATVTGMLANARRLLAGDAAALAMVEAAAAQRLRVLAGEEPGGPLAAEWEAMLQRYEALRAAAGEKSLWANRTRQLRLRHGVIVAIERLVAGKDVAGFRALVDGGAPEATAEAMVLDHPALFGDGIALLARAKLPRRPAPAAVA